MDALLQYVIPFSGLRTGIHEFDFQIDTQFFDNFESSPIKKGNIEVKLYFDRRPQMFELIFDIKGKIHTTCDRCLEEFDLPIQSSESLLVKFAAEASEDAEVVYIPTGSKSLNVAKFIYEFILLSIPMIKTHDDANEECDEQMLKYLDENSPDETENEPKENPVWDALKDFKK